MPRISFLNIQKTYQEEVASKKLAADFKILIEQRGFLGELQKLVAEHAEPDIAFLNKLFLIILKMAQATDIDFSLDLACEEIENAKKKRAHQMLDIGQAQWCIDQIKKFGDSLKERRVLIDEPTEYVVGTTRKAIGNVSNYIF